MKKYSALAVLLSSLFLISISAEIAGYGLVPHSYKSSEQHIVIKGLKSSTVPKILFKLDWESGNIDISDKQDKNIGYIAYFSLWNGVKCHHCTPLDRIHAQFIGTYKRNLDTQTFMSRFGIKGSEDLGNGAKLIFQLFDGENLQNIDNLKKRLIWLSIKQPEGKSVFCTPPEKFSVNIEESEY